MRAQAIGSRVERKHARVFLVFKSLVTSTHRPHRFSGRARLLPSDGEAGFNAGT